ncbi:Diacylglycerol kinase family enzyme [Parasphingorhabdus marina DSM 22363]|uniref:Diacylglycerol kinase family enzyme n=2 Tax=Parasphingorhabdus marina TaxID=394732 RepID=A0A1N6CNY5_9SPHN|nr:Diacylglycerol kinase family enzyme [Parasphingorhabdus marina DSM 22363]
MKVQLIHNPASGTHHELRLNMLAQAFAACGASVTSGTTRLDGDTEIHPDSDLLCISGGDGTLGLVISALLNQGANIPVCVFPAGTVNLVARELGYASDPELFAREVMAGFLAGPAGRLAEPVLVTDHAPVIACFSAGPDGVAVARHSPGLKKRVGKIAYALSFLQLFLRWPRHRFDLQVRRTNGEISALSCEAFYIAKGRFFAGPWSLSPDASLGRKSFELVALNRAGRRGFLRFIWSVARGRNPGNLPHVESMTAQSVELQADTLASLAAAFQVDGDPVSAVPSAIKMSESRIEYCLPRAG